MKKELHPFDTSVDEIIRHCQPNC